MEVRAFITIRVIKSRTMRWTGQITRMGEKRHAYRDIFGAKKQKERGTK
jgi:hypothetical protein